MKRHLPKTKLLSFALAAGTLALAACVNDDYKFDEIDSTVGIGGGVLQIPTSSTDTIKLLDVLELDGSECVVVRPNGDYVFEQQGDNAEPSHPEIDRISVARQSVTSTDIYVQVESAAKPRAGVSAAGVVLSAEGDVQAFEFEGDKPAEVLELDKAKVDASFSLQVQFPAELAACVSELDELTIEMPEYMALENIRSNGSYTVSGSKLMFTDVATSRALTLDADISELNFGVESARGGLTVAGGKIVVDGRVHVTMRATRVAAGADVPENSKISSRMTMSDFIINTATGRFSPSIDLDNLGEVTVDGVPDFLTDGNVVVDLYNPQIMLTISSDLTLGGFVSGDLVAVKDGAEIARVSVPEMRIGAGGDTRICICRRADAVAGDYDVVQQVDNLSDIIRTIPDRISFDAAARADETATCEFELGHRYTVLPSYSVEAPITFDKDAAIVYTDTINDWNEDISDYELAEGSYISMETVIENRVPAYLTLSADAVDTDGNKMGADEMAVEVSKTVLASADGVNSTETPVTVKISQKTPGAMKRLDGLLFTVEGKATSADGESVVGKTLNSEKHFLIARDIKIKLVGKVIADFN